MGVVGVGQVGVVMVVPLAAGVLGGI